MKLTEDEKITAKMYAVNKASFMFIPSSYLCDLIIKGHSKTIGINDSLKIFILQKKAIRLDPKMILDYCNGTLSEKNTWLLDQGDIKVEPNKIELKI